MYSSLLVLLLTLIATGNCEIKCYTTDPIKEEETCVAANNVCYEASSKDESGVCKIMRGCLKQTFTYAQSDAFEENLFANLKKTPSLFSVCNTEKCNNKPPNCDITVVDDGSAVTGGIIGGIIGLIFGVVLGAGLLWFLKVK